MPTGSEKRGRPCRFERDIPAWLQNELSPKARRRFEEHIAMCSLCAANRRVYEQLMADLQAEPAPAPVCDVSVAVQARIANEKAAPWSAYWLKSAWIRVAAVLVCCGLVGGLILFLGRAPGRNGSEPIAPQRVIENAIAWLEASQELDGCWSAARWGAQENYTPGVTALALLAIMSRDPQALDDEGARAVRLGIEYLVGQQNADGRFGRLCSGTPYNQGMATLALLQAARWHAEPRWTQAADRALAYIRATQLASGGWGYPRAPADTGNTSITVWQLQALLAAEAAGNPDVRPSIERGLAWLEGMMDAEGRIGYRRPGDFPNGHQTLTAAALCLLRNPRANGRSERLARVTRALLRDAKFPMEMDYYRYYFLTRALREAGEEQADAIVSRLRVSLAACQVQAGAHVGSFEASDRWSAAGGRVYATAMAVLAM